MQGTLLIGGTSASSDGGLSRNIREDMTPDPENIP